MIKRKGDNDGMFTVKNFFFLHGWRSLKSFLIVNGISGYVWRKELPSQLTNSRFFMACYPESYFPTLVFLRHVRVLDDNTSIICKWCNNAVEDSDLVLISCSWV